MTSPLFVDPAPPSRRRFLKTAGAAALGASVAAPLVGASRAQAQGGTTPAYQDAGNTFTYNQTVMAALGVGVSPLVPLHVRTRSPGTAVEIDAHTMALLAQHTTDLGAQTYDLVNLYHKSCGDAIFIAHQGGVPPGSDGSAAGGTAGYNVLIPYYLDDTNTGRNGSVVNNRTGMRGVKIQSQPPNANIISLEILHWSNAYAAVLQIQPSPAGEPQGTGGGILMDDYSTASSIKVSKWNTPGPGESILNLTGQTPSAIPALTVADSTGTRRVTIRTDGTTALGTPNPFAVRLHAEASSSGIARNLALSNGSGVAGSGAQIEFDDASAQYALIAAAFDQTSAPLNSSLRFSVRAGSAGNGTMTERLRLNGAGIGFFGVTPVAQPTVTGSRGGNAALQSVISGLAAMGLIKDATTA